MHMSFEYQVQPSFHNKSHNHTLSNHCLLTKWYNRLTILAAPPVLSLILRTSKTRSMNGLMKRSTNGSKTANWKNFVLFYISVTANIL